MHFWYLIDQFAENIHLARQLPLSDSNALWHSEKSSQQGDKAFMHPRESKHKNKVVVDESSSKPG